MPSAPAARTWSTSAGSAMLAPSSTRRPSSVAAGAPPEAVTDQTGGPLEPRQHARAVPRPAPQHAPLHVHHVGGALPEVVVLHVLEVRRHALHVAAEHELGVPPLAPDALAHRFL